MKVFGTQASSAPSVRKKQRSNSSSATFSVDTPEEQQAARATGGVASTSPLDALLAMQAVEDENSNESRVKSGAASFSTCWRRLGKAYLPA